MSHAIPHNRALLLEDVEGRFNIFENIEPPPVPLQRASPRERSRLAILDFAIVPNLEVNLYACQEANAIAVVVGMVIDILIQEVITIDKEFYTVVNLK